MKPAFLTRILINGLFVAIALPFYQGNAQTLISSRAASPDGNGSLASSKIIRVVQPGVFDVQTTGYVVRMRAWGVGFPKRDQPGYAEALSFTENRLVLTAPEFKIKREFDEKNLKVLVGIWKRRPTDMAHLFSLS